ncbi:MAG: hypothetical protein ACON35_03340 [Candidatus Marinamargulisbacteria bacterium]
MVQSTKYHVICTCRVKLFSKKVSAFEQIDDQFVQRTKRINLEYQIKKDISTWYPNYDLASFNTKYLNCLVTLSREDIKYYKRYIQPGLRKLVEPKDEVKGESLMLTVLDLLFPEVVEGDIQQKKAKAYMARELVVNHQNEIMELISKYKNLNYKNTDTIKDKILATQSPLTIDSSVSNEGKKSPVLNFIKVSEGDIARSKSMGDLSLGPGKIDSDRLLTPPPRFSRLARKLEDIQEHVKNSDQAYDDKMSTPQTRTQVEDSNELSPEEGIKNFINLSMQDNQPSIFVATIFKIYQELWVEVINEFKKNTSHLPLGASSEPRNWHVFAWCLHNIKKLNGPVFQQNDTDEIWLHYQLLLVITSTMADDLSDSVCPSNMGRLISDHILKHFPQSKISDGSLDLFKDMMWVELGIHRCHHAGCYDDVKETVSAKLIAIDEKKSSGDDNSIYANLVNWLEEEDFKVYEIEDDIAKGVVINAFKTAIKDMFSRDDNIDKSVEALTKLVLFSRGAMERYYNRFVEKKLVRSATPSLEQGGGKRSPTGAVARANKKNIDEKKFADFVNQVSETMVSGYGEASSCSGQLREAIGKTDRPNMVRLAGYDTTYAENMMVRVFLTFMKTFGPVESIFSAQANTTLNRVYYHMQMMPRWANDIATARRELFKDGDCSAEQIRHLLMHKTPLNNSQSAILKLFDEHFLVLDGLIKGERPSEHKKTKEPEQPVDFVFLLHKVKDLLSNNQSSGNLTSSIEILHNDICEYIDKEFIGFHERALIRRWVKAYCDLENDISALRDITGGRPRSKSFDGEAEADPRDDELDSIIQSQLIIFATYLFSGGKQ